MKKVLWRYAKRALAGGAAAALMALMVAPGIALAESQDSPGSAHCHDDNGAEGVWVSIAINGKHCIPNQKGNNVPTNQSVIFIYLTGIIKFLTGGAGVLAVGGVVWGSITYATARGNPGQVQKAITIIINSVIALILFFLLAGIFNYLIPGGIFS